MSIIDFNSAQKGDDTSAQDTAPSYNYRITLKDGTIVEQTGYFVVNSLFAAICRGEEGIIYWAVPFEQFASVDNLGQTASANSLN